MHDTVCNDILSKTSNLHITMYEFLLKRHPSAICTVWKHTEFNVRNGKYVIATHRNGYIIRYFVLILYNVSMDLNSMFSKF